MNSLYLQHHGVKGMKWGVHKKEAPSVSAARANVQASKQNLKNADKHFDRTYNKAHFYSATHPVSQFVRKKTMAEADRRWAEVDKAGERYRDAKSKYAESKQNLKNEKTLVKREAYRDKLVGKAQKHADRNLELHKEANRDVADLKKRGENSDFYRKWKADVDEARARQYEHANTVQKDGETYTKSYRTSTTKAINDISDSISANRKVNDMISERNADARIYHNNAQTWTRRRNDVMNMKVSHLTSKSDIRKVYWS